MKSYKRIIAFFMAVLLCVCFGACAPKGATSDKEWGFRTENKEYAVGTYLKFLADAYDEAYNYLAQNDEFFNPEASILDRVSSFDEGGELCTAKEWILNRGEKFIRYMVAIDSLMESHGCTLDEITFNGAVRTSSTEWYLSQDYEYVVDGYMQAQPLKDKYEPLGISIDSYHEAGGLLDLKYGVLFSHFYARGGEMEVAEKELEQFFTNEYANYSYFIVNLFDTAVDEVSSETVNTPYSDDKKTDVLTTLDTYVAMAQSGVSFDDIAARYAEDFSVEGDDFVTERTESYDSLSFPAEISEIIKNMDSSQLKVIVDDQSGVSPVALVVYKSDAKEKAKDYLADDINYINVVSSLKSDDFLHYLESYADSVKYEVNSDVLDAFSVEFIEDNFMSYKRKIEE